PARADELAAVLGVEAVPFGTVPAAVDAVALAVPGPAAVPLAAQAVEVRVPVVASCDDLDGVHGLLALDAAARERRATVGAGCALAPGRADVRARHAADALDRADEIHVARAGAAGEACVASLRRARRDRPVEWSNGAAREERRLGPELVWFPDPVGARECVT